MSLGSLYSILHNETMELEGGTMFNFIKDLVSGMRFLHAHEPPLIHAGKEGCLCCNSCRPIAIYRSQVAQLLGGQPVSFESG